MEYKYEPQTGVSSHCCSFERRCYLLGFGVDKASTIHGSDFEPSLNSSFVNLPSLFYKKNKIIKDRIMACSKTCQINIFMKIYQNMISLCSNISAF
jgi:hypothetical protein